MSIPPAIVITTTEKASPQTSYPNIPRPTSFKRKVSFDNYKPTSIPNCNNEGIGNYMTEQLQSRLDRSKAKVGNNLFKNSGHPHSSDQHLPTEKGMTIRKSILKKNDLNSSSFAPSSNFNLDSNIRQATETAILNTTNNAFISTNYNSLQHSNSINNVLRKKSYSEMSDSELLALDNQFNLNKGSDNFQKNYGFDVNSRLSPNTFSNSNKDTLNSNLFSHFKNLNLKEYPTKPIITKNSICSNFKNYSDYEFSDKFYLILLSNKSASLSSLDYYLNKFANNGDTIVICCSLSTSILGNDKSDQLNDLIDSFINLILNYLETHSNINIPKLNITFEFFKSFTYLNEVINLYQPCLILVGTNNDKSKSTSITTSNNKLISLVHVGLDYNSKDPNDVFSNNSLQPVVSFKIPFKSNQQTELPEFNHSNSISSYDTIPSDSEKLTKMKTNDTTVSSLFDNLNEISGLDNTLQLSKTVSNSDSTSNNNNNFNTNRRRSMLDVLNSDNLSSINKSSDNVIDEDTDDENNAGVKIQNDDDDNNNNTLPIPKTNYSKTHRRKSSDHSIDGLIPIHNPPNGYMDFQKEKNELFEKYNRRLSAVNVGPKLKASENSSTDSKKKKESKKGGLFSKWFKN